MGFKVQHAMCDTCIYKPDSPLDLDRLEWEARDNYGGFKSYRECHHGKNGTCCRGFWDKHKNKFSAGQIAQRLNAVEFVTEDTFK